MAPSDAASGVPGLGDKPKKHIGTMVPLDWFHNPRYSVGSSGRDLLIRLLTYSSAHLTDGVIPSDMFRSQAAAVDDPDAAERRLLKSGLVNRLHHIDATDDDDYYVTCWADFNLSAMDVQVRRDMKMLAGRKGGANRAASAQRRPDGTFGTSPSPDSAPDTRLDDDQTDDQTAHQHRTSVSPSPVDSPSGRAPSIAPATSEAGGRPIPFGLPPKDRLLGKAS